MPQAVQAQLGFHIITACQPPLPSHILLPLCLSEESSVVDVVVVVVVVSLL